ncbi:hypothetical protein SARC_08897 [Sphaeroforma arctica JP610]|uniref:PKD/REJ-like domain-containing protein n=1 Tax=Sphaeroforma arctica JP610 TaxID=667725 RepID=A0A0L0FPD9_9EUKA|nr:hypothetical protein SARC_08897 [Sphaeroforma arctica JP610]KNC78680.1 hypothetical protein SARC_08897 [Sphaeroforma arctica JP610]|eukprot:XP_014152582.1 hypothetical protein SARC_08897 [Sphaeroforma arctica JP610]
MVVAGAPHNETNLYAKPGLHGTYCTKQYFQDTQIDILATLSAGISENSPVPKVIVATGLLEGQLTSSNAAVVVVSANTNDAKGPLATVRGIGVGTAQVTATFHNQAILPTLTRNFEVFGAVEPIASIEVTLFHEPEFIATENRNITFKLAPDFMTTNVSTEVGRQLFVSVVVHPMYSGHSFQLYSTDTLRLSSTDTSVLAPEIDGITFRTMGHGRGSVAVVEWWPELSSAVQCSDYSTPEAWATVFVDIRVPPPEQFIVTIGSSTITADRNVMLAGIPNTTIISKVEVVDATGVTRLETHNPHLMVSLKAAAAGSPVVCDLVYDEVGEGWQILPRPSVAGNCSVELWLSPYPQRTHTQVIRVVTLDRLLCKVNPYIPYDGSAYFDVRQLAEISNTNPMRYQNATVNRFLELSDGSQKFSDATQEALRREALRLPVNAISTVTSTSPALVGDMIQGKPLAGQMDYTVSVDCTLGTETVSAIEVRIMPTPTQINLFVEAVLKNMNGDTVSNRGTITVNTDRADVIWIDNSGALPLLTLLKNSREHVEVSLCSDLVCKTFLVAANLLADVGDVDIGCVGQMDGPPLDCEVDGAHAIQLSVNTGGFNLTSVQITLQFDPDCISFGALNEAEGLQLRQNSSEPGLLTIRVTNDAPYYTQFSGHQVVIATTVITTQQGCTKSSPTIQGKINTLHVDGNRTFAPDRDIVAGVVELAITPTVASGAIEPTTRRNTHTPHAPTALSHGTGQGVYTPNRTPRTSSRRHTPTTTTGTHTPVFVGGTTTATHPHSWGDDRSLRGTTTATHPHSVSHGRSLVRTAQQQSVCDDEACAYPNLCQTCCTGLRYKGMPTSGGVTGVGVRKIGGDINADCKVNSADAEYLFAYDLHTRRNFDTTTGDEISNHTAHDPNALTGRKLYDVDGDGISGSAHDAYLVDLLVAKRMPVLKDFLFTNTPCGAELGVVLQTASGSQPSMDLEVYVIVQSEHVQPNTSAFSTRVSVLHTHTVAVQAMHTDDTTATADGGTRYTTTLTAKNQLSQQNATVSFAVLLICRTRTQHSETLDIVTLFGQEKATDAHVPAQAMQWHIPSRFLLNQIPIEIPSGGYTDVSPVYNYSTASADVCAYTTVPVRVTLAILGLINNRTYFCKWGDTQYTGRVLSPDTLDCQYAHVPQYLTLVRITVTSLQWATVGDSSAQTTELIEVDPYNFIAINDTIIGLEVVTASVEMSRPAWVEVQSLMDYEMPDYEKLNGTLRIQCVWTINHEQTRSSAKFISQREIQCEADQTIATEGSVDLSVWFNPTTEAHVGSVNYTQPMGSLYSVDVTPRAVLLDEPMTFVVMTDSEVTVAQRKSMRCELDGVLAEIEFLNTTVSGEDGTDPALNSTLRCTFQATPDALRKKFRLVSSADETARYVSNGVLIEGYVLPQIISPTNTDKPMKVPIGSQGFIDIIAHPAHTFLADQILGDAAPMPKCEYTYTDSKVQFATRAPVLTSANVTANFDGVLVVFDTPITIGSNISTCNDLINDAYVVKLGVGNSCEQKGPNSFLAKFGAAATVNEDDKKDVLTLKEGSVFASVEPSMSSNGSLPTSITVKPTVRVVVSGPSIIGPCDDITLSGLGSLGNGGRRFKEFVWSGKGINETRGATLTIPSEAITIGVTYTVTLIVTNWLGTTKSLDRSFKKVADNDTVVVLPEAPEIITALDKTAVLRTTVTAPHCGTTPYEGFLKYSWAVKTDAGAAISDAIVSRLEASAVWRSTQNDSTLVIPPNVLAPGLYRFVLTVTDSVVLEALSTAEISVTVTALPAEAILSSTTTRQPRNTPLVLDGSQSRSRDVKNVQAVDLVYYWTCQYMTNTSDTNVACATDNFTTTSLLTQSLTNATAWPSGDYQFTLTVQDLSKLSTPGLSISSAHTTVSVVDATFPLVTTKRLGYDGSVLSSTSHHSVDYSLILVCETSAQNVRWSGEPPTGAQTFAYGRFSTTSRERRLVVAPYTLTNGLRYHFECLAWDGSANNATQYGSSTIEIETALGPSAGTILIGPEEIVSGVQADDVSAVYGYQLPIQCEQWMDSTTDLNMVYAFGYLHGNVSLAGGIATLKKYYDQYHSWGTNIQTPHIDVSVPLPPATMYVEAGDLYYITVVAMATGSNQTTVMKYRTVSVAVPEEFDALISDQIVTKRGQLADAIREADFWLGMNLADNLLQTFIRQSTELSFALQPTPTTTPPGSGAVKPPILSTTATGDRRRNAHGSTYAYVYKGSHASVHDTGPQTQSLGQGIRGASQHPNNNPAPVVGFGSYTNNEPVVRYRTHRQPHRRTITLGPDDPEYIDQDTACLTKDALNEVIDSYAALFYLKPPTIGATESYIAQLAYMLEGMLCRTVHVRVIRYIFAALQSYDELRQSTDGPLSAETRAQILSACDRVLHVHLGSSPATKTMREIRQSIVFALRDGLRGRGCIAGQPTASLVNGTREYFDYAVAVANLNQTLPVSLGDVLYNFTVQAECVDAVTLTWKRVSIVNETSSANVTSDDEDTIMMDEYDGWYSTIVEANLYNASARTLNGGNKFQLLETLYDDDDTTHSSVSVDDTSEASSVNERALVANDSTDEVVPGEVTQVVQYTIQYTQLTDNYNTPRRCYFFHAEDADPKFRYDRTKCWQVLDALDPSLGNGTSTDSAGDGDLQDDANDTSPYPTGTETGTPVDSTAMSTRTVVCACVQPYIVTVRPRQVFLNPPEDSSSMRVILIVAPILVSLFVIGLVAGLSRWYYYTRIKPRRDFRHRYKRQPTFKDGNGFATFQLVKVPGYREPPPFNYRTDSVELLAEHREGERSSLRSHSAGSDMGMDMNMSLHTSSDNWHGQEGYRNHDNGLSNSADASAGNTLSEHGGMRPMSLFSHHQDHEGSNYDDSVDGFDDDVSIERFDDVDLTLDNHSDDYAQPVDVKGSHEHTQHTDQASEAGDKGVDEKPVNVDDEHADGGL